MDIDSDVAPGESSPLIFRQGDESDALREGEEGRRPASSSSNKEIQMLLRIGPGLLLGNFVVNFDLSYLVTNYSGRIASDLHQLQNAVWIVLAGSICGSCFQPLYAYCANRYGRRSTIVTGSTVMMVGLFLCAASTHLWELSLSRVLVGTGSSGLSLLSTIILNDIVPLSHLALWRSIITVTVAAGLVAGGPLGAKILVASNWHIPFLIEALLSLLVVVVMLLTLRLPRAKTPPERSLANGSEISEEKRTVFDILGGVTMTLFVGMPLLALNLGGSVLPWNHPVIIALFSTIPFFLAGLLYAEGYMAKAPIFPARFFTSVPILLINFCTIMVIFAYNQIVFSLSFYAQVRDIDGKYNFQDWALTCVFLGQPIGSFLSGLLLARYSRVKTILGGGVFLGCILYLCLAVGWIQPEKPGFAPILMLFGFSIGICESSLTVGLFGTVRKEDQAALYALFDLIVAFSGDLAITISSAMTRIWTTKYLRSSLSNSDEAAKIIEEAQKSLEYVRTLSPEIRKAVLGSFIHAIKNSFVLSTVLITLGLIAVPFIKTSMDDGGTEDTGEGEEFATE